MKKLLAVGVIVLFLGLACAPSINANVSKNSELVEITTEICGLGGGRYTVQLTKEEAEEVDRLFENIRLQLDESTSREEAVEVFNEAVVELDKYNLLSGLSIDQARRLILGEISNSFSLIYNYEGKNNTMNNNGENFNCLIAGRSTYTRLFYGRPTILGRINEILKSNEFDQYMDWLQTTFPLFYRFVILPLFLLIFLPTLFIDVFFPHLYDSRTNGNMTFGVYIHNFEHDDVDHPSEGWVWTDGSNGVIKWEEPVYGQIKTIRVGDENWDIIYYDYYVGAVDFKGIKLRSLEGSFFIGRASHVALDPFY